MSAHLCACRSSCCRVVSRGWQRMVAVQAQGATATWAWRSPVATSEFHAKLCGNVCWFVKDLKFTSFLWPCYYALPIGDNISVMSNCKIRWPWLDCFEQISDLLGQSRSSELFTVWLKHSTSWFFNSFFASMQTRIIEIPFGSGFTLECQCFCVAVCVHSTLNAPGGTWTSLQMYSKLHQWQISWFIFPHCLHTCPVNWVTVWHRCSYLSEGILK